MSLRVQSTALRHWITAARPVGHGMIAIPLLWGQALALVVTQQFDWQWFLIIQAFGLLCQVYVLYLNDYADESIDRLNQTYWLSGGSRVIPEGHLSGQQLYAASFVALLGLLMIGTGGYALGRSWMPVCAGLAIALGWSYSLTPLKASYRGYGEFHQALSCGVFLPVTAFYLQTGSLQGFPWLLSLPACLIFYAGNIITALPDEASDKLGNKLSYPVRHGGKRARRDALLLLLVAYSLIIAVSMPWLDLWSGGLLISGPAIALLLYVYHSGLVERAEVSSRPLIRRYILLTTMSQLWVMLWWTLLLFWHGLQNA